VSFLEEWKSLGAKQKHFSSLQKNPLSRHLTEGIAISIPGSSPPGLSDQEQGNRFGFRLSLNSGGGVSLRS
jgi:hypothetical protein